MSITETTLEMHFHASLIELFRETFGLGRDGFNYYKYSTQKECFVGFDQAYIRSELSDEELFRMLKESVDKRGYNLSNFFVGYFLQYKVVNEKKNRMRHTPQNIFSSPHYRVSLDTKKNVNSGYSQHELLYLLNHNRGAMVYYACPMIFDKSQLYARPELDLLRLADLSTCPGMYDDNETHYIYFDDARSEPLWCSDPVEGIAVSPDKAFYKIKEKIVNQPESLRDEQLFLLDFLSPAHDYNALVKHEKILSSLMSSLTIISYSKPEIRPLRRRIIL